jgi:hypothetical protein
MIPSTPEIEDGDMAPWSMHGFTINPWDCTVGAFDSVLYSNEADGPMNQHAWTRIVIM